MKTLKEIWVESGVGKESEAEQIYDSDFKALVKEYISQFYSKDNHPIARATVASMLQSLESTNAKNSSKSNEVK